jgi:hypothetical protein
VDVERTGWGAIVVICGIAVVLLALEGYTGYSLTVAAVGAAAAVNLL